MRAWRVRYTDPRSFLLHFMRRVPCVLLAIILASCARVQGVAPAEVLRRAARASQELSSAHVSVIADLSSTTSAMHIEADGRMQDAGRQMAFMFSVENTSRAQADAYQWQATGEVIVAAEEEVYLRLLSLGSNPPHPLIGGGHLAPLLKQWWHIPQEGQRQRAPITPDPRFLRLQTEIVHVEHDRGITDLRGDEAYHYDVRLDERKLLAFLEEVARERGETFDEEEWGKTLNDSDIRGELWIDVERYVLHQASWTVTPREESRSIDSQTFTLLAVIRDHDAADPVVPPTESKPFSPEALQGLFLPPSATVDPDDAQEGWMDALLRGQ